jgi:hypothetical protein
VEGLVASEFCKVVGREGEVVTNAAHRGGRCHGDCDSGGGTRRKTEINDSINDSFLSRLGLKLPINDSNNVFGFESFSMSRLCHLSRLLTRG